MDGITTNGPLGEMLGSNTENKDPAQQILNGTVQTGEIAQQFTSQKRRS